MRSLSPTCRLSSPPCTSGLPALIARDRQARLDTARAQVAYDTEVASLALSKLQAYFNDTLQEHVVVVHALGPAPGGRALNVTTIRPPELPRAVLVSAAACGGMSGHAQLRGSAWLVGSWVGAYTRDLQKHK